MPSDCFMIALPVFQGRCVGIAFQSLTGDAQLIGYVIPACVVRHFLEDVARHGRYTGFPSLNIGERPLHAACAAMPVHPETHRTL